VLGHSGTTGYDSDPDIPLGDARENSWATGNNPQVNSIYQRLLADHPALEGHATSLGMDGSVVHDLEWQTDDLLRLDPLPDIVIIQTIDNDIRCDGTDADNYGPFGDTLDGVLSTIETSDANAQVFFVAQWGSVRTYADAVAQVPEGLTANSGNGPCDLFSLDGRPRRAAQRHLQEIVDAYFDRIVEVCARHSRCFTDGGALQDMRLQPSDLTSDFNHLSVTGQAAMAAAAWDALPEAIKRRS
jgi:hypothetical protein